MIYESSADVYDLLYERKDYAAEVTTILGIFADRTGKRFPSSVLDVACGTGRHLEAFATTIDDVSGIDLSSGLIAHARRRLPSAVLSVSDMRSFTLGRRFDLVTCLFSSIAYVNDEHELQQTICQMASHVSSGGIMLVEPWFGPDQWHDGYIALNVGQRDDLKVARMSTSRTEGEVSIMDFHYLIGTPSETRHVFESHRMCLFTDSQYRSALASVSDSIDLDNAGLSGERVAPTGGIHS